MTRLRKSVLARGALAAWGATRLALWAVILGSAAGAAACITYLSMIALQQTIWHGADWFSAGGLSLPLIVLPVIGGLLVGWTRLQAPGTGIEDQIAAARRPTTDQLRATLWTGLGAVFAVAFGGAIGPEAGILAVTAQLSTVVALSLGRTAAEQGLLAEAGLSGALSGVYGSPAGGPAHAEAEDRAPRPILFAAGLAGFASFVILAETMRPGALALMHLPRLTAMAGIWDSLVSLLPALAGAIAGALFLVLKTSGAGLLERHVPWPFWQPVAGGALLGLLALASPLLLFSGHEELAEMLHIGRAQGPLPLVLLSLGKVLACAACVASGWRGGVVFPLCFAGGAMGGAMLFVVPGVDPVIGVAAGMAAAAAVGMTRPLVAGLIMLFILGGGLAVPVFAGTLVGWGLLRVLPQRLSEAAAGHPEAATTPTGQ